MQKEKKVKLLILTQKVDINDPILGFFHRWIEEFAKHCEQVTVITLGIGKYNLPSNVRVFSLGKELRERSDLKNLGPRSVLEEQLQKVRYILNFYRLIWRERKNYDVVFVHMNQEYVLLGGLLWKTLGKKITMWRNHYAGSFLTDIAASFCDTVFCTSKYSYTAKYKKTVLMPVGIDTETFSSNVKGQISKVKDSILFLARIAPSKKPELLIDALRILKNEDVLFIADFYGDAESKNAPYLDSLKRKVKEYGLESKVFFRHGVPNNKTPEIYGSHAIFVNTSPSGMYDKTIFEAMACETLILTSNLNLNGQIDDMFLFAENDVNDLAKKLEAILNLDADTQATYGKELRTCVSENHSLSVLSEKLADTLKNEKTT